MSGLCSLKYVEIQPWVPINVTLFQNRLFAAAIKLDEVLFRFRWAVLPYKKKTYIGQTAAECGKHKPRNAKDYQHHQKLGKTEENLSWDFQRKNGLSI